MSHRIVNLIVRDVRFPTSDEHHGSDAMVSNHPLLCLFIRDGSAAFILKCCSFVLYEMQHTDPDYSTAYVVLEADSGLKGFGITFTLGRGTDIGEGHAPACGTADGSRDVDDNIPRFSFVKRLRRHSEPTSQCMYNINCARTRVNFTETLCS